MISVIITFGIVCALLLILAAVLTVVVTKHIVNKIYVPMRYKTINLTTSEFFSELALIIQNEIDLYERDVFENRGKFLDNQTFEKYYIDICEHIGNDIPEEFYAKFSYYMKEPAVKEFIARTVRAYLQGKIAE